MEIQAQLRNLKEQFTMAVKTRGAAPCVTEDPLVATKTLHNLSEERTRIFCEEIREILDASRLAQQRLCLILQFRTQIFKNAALGANALILKDVRTCARNVEIALHHLKLAKSAILQSQISLLEKETTQLAHENKVIAKYLRPGSDKARALQELRDLCKPYTSPRNPLASFNETTENMAVAMERMASLSLKRAEHNLKHIDYLDRVVRASLSNHTGNFEAQTKEILSDTRAAFRRVEHLVFEANTYRYELKYTGT